MRYNLIFSTPNSQDCADYRKVLAQLQQQDSAITSQLDEDIDRLRTEEEALLKELDEVSEERASVAAELAALQISERELEKEEEQLHREINQYEHRLAEVRTCVLELFQFRK